VTESQLRFLESGAELGVPDWTMLFAIGVVLLVTYLLGRNDK